MREFSPDNLRIITETFLPVDPVKIAQFLGYKVIYESIDSADAYLLFLSLPPLIVINEKASVNRRRFSVAHEIGHIMCGHEISEIGCNNIGFNMFSPNKLEAEKEADIYASELLMPDIEISLDIASEFSLSFAIHVAEEKYGVSIESYLIRLAKKADYPITIMHVYGHTIKWSVSSNSWDDSIDLNRYFDLAGKKITNYGEWADDYDCYDDYKIIQEKYQYSQYNYDIVVLYTQL